MVDFTGESCCGCGIYAPAHPWVAVVNAVDAGTGSDPLVFVALPACAACQQAPGHRQRPIKGTFFLRAERAIAVSLAGERDADGNPVRS